MKPVDVLIIGSGMGGSTYLRVIADALPEAMILLVEAGPRITNIPGVNIKNIADDTIRETAQVASQGPTQFPYDEHAPGMDPVRAAEVRHMIDMARPGTFLLEAEERIDFPAGAASSNVGGMGAHWTCACPVPDGPERIPFIDSAEMDRLIAKSQQLLEVHTDLFQDPGANNSVLEHLRRANPTGARPISPMPMACRIDNTGKREWTGPATIFAHWAAALADPASPQTLLSNTLALKILFDGANATGALLRDRITGHDFVVEAKVVVVAADSIRTPQLLWNSNIRPEALGCYLNEHPQVLAAVSYLAPASESTPAPDLGVFWVPFDDIVHPFHGQILPLSVSPIPIQHSGELKHLGHTLALSWFCRKDIRREDRVIFSANEQDFLGMPAPRIFYSYSDADRKTLAAATEVVRRTAAHLGRLVKGEEPRVLPAGRSLHYQGTVRMGATDDGESVCNSESCVWGFENLFVAGNGVIPTATACNPTMTTVAVAVRGAERAVAILKR